MNCGRHGGITDRGPGGTGVTPSVAVVLAGPSGQGWILIRSGSLETGDRPPIRPMSCLLVRD